MRFRPLQSGVFCTFPVKSALSHHLMQISKASAATVVLHRHGKSNGCGDGRTDEKEKGPGAHAPGPRKDPQPVVAKDPQPVVAAAGEATPLYRNRMVMPLFVSATSSEVPSAERRARTRKR